MTTTEFISIYNKAYPSLKGYAIKMTGSEADGMDILQEASIRAYAHREDVENAKSFNGWMYTIIKNTYINKYTKVVRRRALLEKAPKTTFHQIQKTGENYGASLVSMELLMNRINKVKDIYREPFLLHFKGYSYDEIAERFEVPIGTVKSRIFTAKKKMQKVLEPALAA